MKTKYVFSSVYSRIILQEKIKEKWTWTNFIFYLMQQNQIYALNFKNQIKIKCKPKFTNQ